VTVYDPEAAFQLSDQHATHPEPGDYWHEMGCPIYLVVSVGVDHVWVLHRQKPVDHDHWTWDTDKIQVMPLAEFKRSLAYEFIRGYSANVVPAQAAGTVANACCHLPPPPEPPAFDYQI
jgi:hypothetical protein